MGTFDDLMAELNNKIEAGEAFSAEDIARIKAATDASPLRAELSSVKQEAAELRRVVRAENFKRAGININPDILAVPETVDYKDPEKIREWAVEAGIVQREDQQPPTESAEKEQINDISHGAPAGAQVPKDEVDFSGVKDLPGLVARLEGAGWTNSRGKRIW